MAISITSYAVSNGVVRNEKTTPTLKIVKTGGSASVTNVDVLVLDGNVVVYHVNKDFTGNTFNIVFPVSAMPNYKKWYKITSVITNGSDHDGFTIQQALYRNPTPQIEPTITKGWGIIRDEQDRNLIITYTSNNTNGVCNCYRFQIINHDTQAIRYDRILPLGTHTTGDVTKSSTFVIHPYSFDLKTRYEFKIIPGFKYDASGTESYLWGVQYFNDNALYRNPTPIDNNAISYSQATQVSTEGVLFTSGIIDYFWSQEVGFANKCKVSLLSGTTVVYTENLDRNVEASTFGQFQVDINDISSDYLGDSLALKIEPYFEANGTSLFSANKTIQNVYRFDAGLQELTLIAPANEHPIWFNPINTPTPKSLRFILRLPYDNNYDHLTPEEQAAYRYKSFSVTIYKQTGTVYSKIVDFDTPNVILGNIDPITHNEDVVLNLDSLLLNFFNGVSSLRFVFAVESPYGSTVSKDVTVNFKNLPITYKNSPLTGQTVTANILNEYLEAESILATWTDVAAHTSYENDFRGLPISYLNFVDIAYTISRLYNLTKDINTTNKYDVPMDILNDIVAPSYTLLNATKLNGGYDYIYNNTSAIGTALDPVFAEPSDWSTLYNKYFKKNKHYVWRSLDTEFDTDVVYKGINGDYNVLYTYYMLIYELIADVVDIEPVEDYIAGTLAGTLSTDAFTVTKYSLSELPNLRRIILGDDISNIEADAFSNTTGVTELYLLYENAVVTVANVSTLSPLTGATVKVPSSLVTAYQNDTSFWGKSSLHFTFEAL